jgi:thiol-disulfide isomerase/thioredoxin
MSVPTVAKPSNPNVLTNSTVQTNAAQKKRSLKMELSINLNLLSLLLVSLTLLSLLASLWIVLMVKRMFWGSWIQSRRMEKQLLEEWPQTPPEAKFGNVDVSPDIQNIKDQIGKLEDLTQDEIEWARERGALDVEEIVEMVEANKRGEL